MNTFDEMLEKATNGKAGIPPEALAILVDRLEDVLATGHQEDIMELHEKVADLLRSLHASLAPGQRHALADPSSPEHLLYTLGRVSATQQILAQAGAKRVSRAFDLAFRDDEAMSVIRAIGDGRKSYADVLVETGLTPSELGATLREFVSNGIAETVSEEGKRLWFLSPAAAATLAAMPTDENPGQIKPR
jgi:hypothetical protein